MILFGLKIKLINLIGALISFYLFIQTVNGTLATWISFQDPINEMALAFVLIFTAISLASISTEEPTY